VTITKRAFDLSRQFILGDLRREVEWGTAWHDAARKPHLVAANIEPSGGGNFLAALGALCYTEYGGWLQFGKKQPSVNFNRFFNTLGSDYPAFNRAHNVYDTFRCGMAHEYFVKTLSFGISLDEHPPFPCEHHLNPPPGTPEYLFHVGRYLIDLERAFQRLENTLTFPIVRTSTWRGPKRSPLSRLLASIQTAIGWP
jgi:hypothetical protein